MGTDYRSRYTRNAWRPRLCALSFPSSPFRVAQVQVCEAFLDRHASSRPTSSFRLPNS